MNISSYSVTTCQTTQPHFPHYLCFRDSAQIASTLALQTPSDCLIASAREELSQFSVRLARGLAVTINSPFWLVGWNNGAVFVFPNEIWSWWLGGGGWKHNCAAATLTIESLEVLQSLIRPSVLISSLSI